MEDSFQSPRDISSLRVLRRNTVRLVRFVWRLLWSRNERLKSLRNRYDSLQCLAGYRNSLILSLHRWGDRLRVAPPDHSGVSKRNYLRHPKEHHRLHHVLAWLAALVDVWLLVADDSSNFHRSSLSWRARWAYELRCAFNLFTDNAHSVVDALHLVLDQQKKLKKTVLWQYIDRRL